VMCPEDDSHLTLEFADHYVIRPAIRFVVESDYACNALGERGQPVEQGFEYSSGTNPVFLNVEEIRTLLAESGSYPDRRRRERRRRTEG